MAARHRQGHGAHRSLARGARARRRARRRCHHDPARWDESVVAYEAELATEPALAAADLRGRLRDGPVTLLYAARDEARNNAVALTRWPERRP
jgi:uncharacterized protein YeaO (DUF488 family)